MITHKTTPETVVLRVRFPEAQTVFALGPFNNWSTTATALEYAGVDLWELILPPNANAEGLCFFVLRIGESIGHIRDHILKSRNSKDARAGRLTRANSREAIHEQVQHRNRHARQRPAVA